MESDLQILRKKLLLTKNIIERRFPVNYSNQDAFLFSKEIKREFPNLYCMYYKNICINAEQYLWKNLRFIDETFFRRENRRQEKLSNYKFLIKSLFKRKKAINNGLWLIDNWSKGYFHWFGDVLQKYYSLEGKVSKIILPYTYSKIDFITESARFLNIDLIFINKSAIIKCKNLIIIPTSFVSGNFYDGTMNTIQSKFSKTTKPKNRTSKILYLSRKLTNRRKVTNDKEIGDFVKQIGGDVLMLEKIPWKKQLEYFRNCKFLISPHGAGLTNMLFCCGNVKIVEFRHHNSQSQNMYFSMASALKLDYYYINCQGDEPDPHISNIEVPIEKLNSLLDSFVN